MVVLTPARYPSLEKTRLKYFDNQKPPGGQLLIDVNSSLDIQKALALTYPIKYIDQKDLHVTLSSGGIYGSTRGMLKNENKLRYFKNIDRGGVEFGEIEVDDLVLCETGAVNGVYNVVHRIPCI